MEALESPNDDPSRAGEAPGCPPRPGPPFEPPNPVLVRVWRGDAVESVHRGSFALARPDGTLAARAGDPSLPVYTRSSIKAIQALPLVESGAADRFGFGPRDLAVACASHSGEPCHVETVRGMLARIGLGEDALLCGPQEPGDPEAREALRASGRAAGALHNNCSGKHAGFLALAVHLGVPPERYLDPESEGQRLVRRALAELADLDPRSLGAGVDGCSAPNFRVPVAALATAFARLANPDGLAPARAEACRRLTDAVAAHPVLVGGSRRRLDTDLARASGGRLFPKIGAEAVYAIGVRGAGLGLALKVDDGGRRAVEALVPALLERLGLAAPEELGRLAAWRDPRARNRAGLVVGRVEVVAAGDVAPEASA